MGLFGRVPFAGTILPGTRLEGKQTVHIGAGLFGEVDRRVALFLGQVLVSAEPLKLDLQLLLELLGVALFERRYERGGDALGASTASAADAVDEVVRGVGQVVVDDVRDVGDVDPAGGDIGGDQDA